MSDPPNHPQGPPPPAPRRRSRKRWVIGSLVALPLLLMLYACAIEPYWIEVTRHDVGKGSREVTILHLTDIHFSEFGLRERRVLEVAAEVNPDMIVITGDSILRNFNTSEFTDFMSQLKAPLGVYACRGNWEDWVGMSVFECYDQAGVRLLDDRSVVLQEGAIEVIGLSSARSRIPAGRGRLRIVLCHYPIIFPAASKNGIDLVFAGHTHGGQIRLPFVGALHLPFDSGNYEAGWYQEGTCRMYVSRGVGTSGIHARFLCRPEIAIHRVRFEDGP